VANGADVSNAPSQVLDPHGYDPVVAELVAEIKPRFGFHLHRRTLTTKAFTSFQYFAYCRAQDWKCTPNL
jgi:hypothetical protein